MKRYSFLYGTSCQSVTIDEGHVINELMGKDISSITDEVDAMRQAIEHPIGGNTLSQIVTPEKNIVIIVSDATRDAHTPEILQALTGELNALGVRDDRITILIALGTHRRQTEEEDVIVCGKDMVKRFSIVQHDCHDDENLVYVGTTSYGNRVRLNRLAVEADVVIATGTVSFHDMAGFGGGRKAIVPGIAAYDTIMYNHALALDSRYEDGMDPHCNAGDIDHNRLHHDLMEGASFLHPDFLINTVLTGEEELYAVVCGDWRDAWKEGCRLLQQIQGAPIMERTDVVIGACGGYPKDINLYQATKAHMNAIFALKPGGILILAMACPDIMEPPAFTDWFFRDDVQQVLEEVSKDFTIPAFSAYKTRILMNTLDAVYIVTEKENFPIIEKTGQIPMASVEETWQAARERLKKRGLTDYTVTVMPYATSTLPIFTLNR